MTKNNKKGFTIIEVVLVLAIGGLIFLMVFIALPALQSSQRNTQRGNDLSRLLTAVNDYQSNNNGKTPWETGSTDTNFVKRYMDDTCSVASTNGSLSTYSGCGAQFTDPDGNIYAIRYMGEPSSASQDVSNGNQAGAAMTFANSGHAFIVYRNAGCGDEGKVIKGNGKRQIAVFMVEEGNSITCNDNH